MFRAFKHQMFEQVGKTGAARSFVLGSDVVPQVHCNHRQLVMLMHDDVEPVGQRALDVRYFHR